MPTVQNLKKKLQVIRSIQKLTQAMKTASTVKYSKLSSLYGNYEQYADRCNTLYECYRNEFNSVFPLAGTDAPCCYIVMTSNKGMCGNFNTELLSFLENELKGTEKTPLVFVIGKKGVDYFDSKKISYDKAFVFDDIPSYTDAQKIFEHIKNLINESAVSAVKMVHPHYQNMMHQSPCCSNLFTFERTQQEEDPPLFVPDKDTVIQNTAEKILVCILYKKLLETALGAQAATLTAMRSAYDTACEYRVQLESEINRKRQSQVTSDVIEISSEYSMKGDE